MSRAKSAKTSVSRRYLLVSSGGLLAQGLLAACSSGATSSVATAVPAPTMVPGASTTAVGSKIVSDNQPAVAVRKAYDALQSGDMNAYLDALDPALRQGPEPFRLTSIAVQALTGFNIDLSKVSFRDMSYQVTSIQGDWANVHVTGHVRSLSLGSEQPIDTMETAHRINGQWYLSSAMIADADAPLDPALKLSLASVKKVSSTKEGWAAYKANFYLENHSDRLVPLRLIKVKSAQVMTRSGNAYPAAFDDRGPAYRGSYYFPLLSKLIASALPPGSRISGVGGRDTHGEEGDADNANDVVVVPLALEFSVPETLQPDRIELGEYGTFEVSKASTLPTPFLSSEPKGTQTVPGTVEVPGTVKMSVAVAGTRSHEYATTSSDVVVPLELKSLSSTADTAVQIRASLLLESGVLIPDPNISNLPDTAFYGYHPVTIGPLQSKTVTMGFEVLNRDLRLKKWLILDGTGSGTFALGIMEAAPTATLAPG